MKLLVLSHAALLAVNQQFYVELEKTFDVDITIVTPASWSNEYGSEINPQRNPEFRGKLIEIPILNSGNVPLHIYRSSFAKLLRQENPDFIYVCSEPYSVAAFQLYLANHLTIKKPIGFFTWQNISKQYPIPFSMMEKWILQNTNVMFPGSHGAEVVFRQKGYTGPSHILPASIDPSLYRSYADAMTLNEELSESKDTVLIGYVGRIVKEKGLETLLKALKLISSLDWKLVLIGSGDYEVEFERLAHEMGLRQKIKCLGFIPHSQTPRYMAAFDLLVIPSETQPSWKEQFGRVIIESMACSTPVVGSSSGEIPNIIQRTGGGLVFTEGNSTELADQLKKVMLDPIMRAKLAERGRDNVLANHTNSVAIESFLKTVKSLL